MIKSLNTFFATLSLGLYCLAVLFYIDLHLGHDLVVHAITLELATFIISISLSKSIGPKNDDAYYLITLVAMIISSGLLYFINYVNVITYLVALSCIVVPTVFISLAIARSMQGLPVKTSFLSVFIGAAASLFIAYLSVEYGGSWLVFSLSFFSVTLLIIFSSQLSMFTRASALLLFFGVMMFLGSSDIANKLALWSWEGNPVTKPSLNLMAVSKGSPLSINKTGWTKSGRVDIVSTARSQSEGYSWIVYNAGINVPFTHSDKADSNWWKQRYPLIILPFYLKESPRVLTISDVKGPEINISKNLFGADTSSIYHGCVPVNVDQACDYTSLHSKLSGVFNKEVNYDLVLFSDLTPAVTPHIGASVSYEPMHTIETFKSIYQKLDSTGLLSIAVRDPVILYRSLAYIFDLIANDDADTLSRFADRLRILQVSKYTSYRDSYNYLILLSRSGFTQEQLGAIDNFIASTPVEKIIYDSENKEPPYDYFRNLDRVTVHDALEHFRKMSSWKYRKQVSIVPSKITNPRYYHLATWLHPFTAFLSALFLFVAIYGLLFSNRQFRLAADDNNSPAYSLVLFFSMLTVLAFVLIAYPIFYFSMASLGYSPGGMSILFLLTMAVFILPHTLLENYNPVSGDIRGAWFFGTIILISSLSAFFMLQSIEALFSINVLPAIYLSVILISFSSGMVHRQFRVLMQKLYPGSSSWFWVASSISIILGGILSQYLLISISLASLITTAIVIYLAVLIISRWLIATTAR